MTERKIYRGLDFLISDYRPEDVFTPEEFNQEQKMVFDTAVEFVKKEVWADIERIEEKDETHIRSLMRTAGEIGLNGADIPEEYGGEGMDKICSCLVSEALGSAASFAVSHSAQTGIGSLPLVYFGTDEQKRKYLPRIAGGEWIPAYCLTESNAGSDALSIQATAELSEDGKHYLINGEKIFITNGSWADVFMVYAKVNGDKFTGFIVERSFPGISSGAEEKKLGIRGSSTAPVVFKDCRVPLENVLYKVGKGHKIAFNILNIGRYKLGAGVTGSAKTVLSEAAKYADTRKQFGQKIGSFGMIKSKLADMTVRTYMAESLTYRLAAVIEDSLGGFEVGSGRTGEATAGAIEEFAVECSILKVFASECIDFCADELVQIFGGNGYIADYPAERIFRDSRINRIFEGTNEVNRLLIAGTTIKRTAQGRLALPEAARGLEELLQAASPVAKNPDDSLLFAQRRILQNSKKAVIAVLGTAMTNLKTRLQEEQELLSMLADMLIRICVMESGLLRAEKVLMEKGESGAEYHVAVVKVYMNDAVPEIESLARQILLFVEKGPSIAAGVETVGRLLEYLPEETIFLKRRIADKVLKGKKYPF